VSVWNFLAVIRPRRTQSAGVFLVRVGFGAMWVAQNGRLTGGLVIRYNSPRVILRRSALGKLGVAGKSFDADPAVGGGCDGDSHGLQA